MFIEQSDNVLYNQLLKDITGDKCDNDITLWDETVSYMNLFIKKQNVSQSSVKDYMKEQ